jgi:hypothetical protein
MILGRNVRNLASPDNCLAVSDDADVVDEARAQLLRFVEEGSVLKLFLTKILAKFDSK